MVTVNDHLKDVTVTPPDGPVTLLVLMIRWVLVEIEIRKKKTWPTNSCPTSSSQTKLSSVAMEIHNSLDYDRTTNQIRCLFAKVLDRTRPDQDCRWCFCATVANSFLGQLSLDMQKRMIHHQSVMENICVWFVNISFTSHPVHITVWLSHILMANKDYVLSAEPGIMESLKISEPLNKQTKPWAVPDQTVPVTSTLASMTILKHRSSENHHYRHWFYMYSDVH